jgi:hypothetical protein
MKMDYTQCSEMLAIKHHTPGNNPKDYTQHLEHGKSLKSRKKNQLPVAMFEPQIIQPTA